MAYRPKPSQTRYGQAVDNPPLLDDTARLRVILQDHREDVYDALTEIQRIQAVHTDRWQEYFILRKEMVYQESIRNIWIALTAIGSVDMACFIWLLSRVH